MTAALGTLPFLATLWLLVVLGASVLEESGAKIAAALKGEPRRLPIRFPLTRSTGRSTLRRVRCARPQLRAAA
jgi:hypothetical protein